MALFYPSDSYYHRQQYPPIPIKFWFFLIVFVLVLCFSWYINYESKVEDFLSKIKLYLLLTPVVLLLLMHCLSSLDPHRVPSVIPLPERESVHRDGGSPWGVAALLILLIYLVSYQPKSQHWFPFASK